MRGRRRTLGVAATLARPRGPDATVSAADITDAQDRRLIDGVLRGDEDAFRGLFGRYAPTAMALARRVVRQPHLAEEIVQEAFLALWRDPTGYDPTRGSVRAWLFGAVHHRAVDAVRREESQRRRAEQMVAGVRDEVPDHAEDVVQGLAQPTERRAVRDALGRLPAEQRRVLELMYFDGLTQTEVADATGLPLGTVKSRTLLGMRRMRTALEELER
jgi:RNA polymerase sigma-70 factor, ECF subfamily